MRYEIRVIWKKVRCERLYQPVVKAEGKKFRNARIVPYPVRIEIEDVYYEQIEN